MKASYFEPTSQYLQPNSIKPFFPKFSLGWLMFYGIKQYSKSFLPEFGIVLFPMYNSHKLSIISPTKTSSYRGEFFFYHDEKYIVYEVSTYGLPTYEIYNTSGVFKQKIEVQFGDNRIINSQAYSSPSSRYFMFLVEFKVCNPEEGSDQFVYKAKIMELTLDPFTEKFSFEERHEIANLTESFGGTNYDYSYSSSYYMDFYITDHLEVIFTKKYDDILFYREKDYSHYVKEKLGRLYYDPNQYNKMGNFNIEWGNAGIFFFQSSEIYYLLINQETKTLNPMMKISTEIIGNDINVNRIHTWLDPNLLIILFSKYPESLIIIWDLVKNREHSNFSCSIVPSEYVMNKNSKAGYMISDTWYINLDSGLRNYYFGYNFNEDTSQYYNKGIKLNSANDIMLKYGSIVLKENFVSTVYLDDYLSENEKLSETTISLEKVHFQIDKCTLIHYYALDYDNLSIILDFYEQNNPQYLLAILI